MPKHFHIKKASSEIIVWYLSETENELFNLIKLSADEKIDYSKIKNIPKKLSFLVVRKLVRDFEFSELRYAKNGKPLLDGGNISISHSGHWLVVQFSKTVQVGIDVEQINSRILKIKDRFLSSKEIDIICESKYELMILLWGAKEAIFKKHGGETVFFKENILAEEINEETRTIEIKYKKETGFLAEKLFYFYTNDGYAIVHTM